MTDTMLPPQTTAQIDDLCALAPVIPVLTIERVEDALPLAEALVAGGLPVLEITLRSDAALDAIEAIARALPEARIGAGTVLNGEQYRAACDAGASFIVSPGATAELLDYGSGAEVPLLPGIHTVSEMMEGIARGYRRFKFFPAEIAGGVNALKALQGPFADIRFCPTGGIRAHSAAEYLALDNVMCVGGTWLTPAELVAAGDWPAITRLAQQTLQAVR
ncbi:bifunctional 4-hydroxy-2-oxoglutarate aldolase/2-dehydro-3-deoxy-phosphogluconate aldolase [Marinobacterium arenosum]|uniref:bifunctional 4-hydroxy-2-oxoglutarate aldolase/2-dehydro-3-deoxy-phosphogluconate aldolase n=1 Tax=Marinobacterium arenosum TaxID=2862496 RepID=UPI0028F455EE|nr:bifunctional 4-hydroxy-2-oxoglutarate aldolase/2-dehydro-3-deoxy-phosphogluconate aldolase [Marinobacterium arenosum]